MRDRIEDLSPASVAVISFASVEENAEHRRMLDLPFPVLSDPQRDVYGRFDLGRGSLREIWGLETMRMYARLLRAGRRLRRPTADTRQLGGDYVLDSTGRLSAVFEPRTPAGRPSIDDLIGAIENAA